MKGQTAKIEGPGEGGSLGGDVPSPAARRLESAVKLPQYGIWGYLPATSRLRMFYRLIKPLLVSILLILNLFQ